MWMDLQIITLSEVRQRKTNIIWYHLYVESKNKWYMWTYLQNRNRLVQDDVVERRALTSSCKSIEITTNCWTTIDRKTLEPTKKDNPDPKTKGKSQWDGRKGAIMIKSNPITGQWATHKLENNYTTEVLPFEWRYWAPRQASQPGVQQWE